KRHLDNGKSYLVEVPHGEYCISMLDAEGRVLDFYRYDDYEMGRFHERLGELELDSWTPEADVPSLEERNGNAYANTLPRGAAELKSSDKESLAWSAGREPDAHHRWGDSLCDKCRDMFTSIWIVSFPDGAGSQNCESCVINRVAEVIGAANPRDV